ncbi:hypothetical protein BcFMB_09040 [Bifidobacterium choerinum]|uniref:Uncharacterized protein n=1 Tax=Bifidobacterium choerinum TaxID=35760 RepID=A0A2D3D6L0_9BIFI|nr:hypothetical protein BcFMB_09040 [Bifidobacterium choerinum]
MLVHGKTANPMRSDGGVRRAAIWRRMAAGVGAMAMCASFGAFGVPPRSPTPPPARPWLRRRAS